MELHENYDAWAAMLAECFGEEAGTRAQMQGLAGTDTLLLRQCGGMLRAFDRIGGATAWGDCEGLALGCFWDDAARLNQCLQEELTALAQDIPPETLEAVQRNSAEITKAARPDWYLSALGTEAVYILQALAVRRDCRGTGIFRKLLTPILEAARQRGVPVVLQTFEAENVPKYEHLGFRLVGRSSSHTMGLTCYNMACP